MNQLVETIEWAVVMGFDVKRATFADKTSVVTVPEIKTKFWFDSDGDLEVIDYDKDL